MAWTGKRLHIDESELMCRTGCGFYGNPAWDGHCSMCYKDRGQLSSTPAQPSPTQSTRKPVFHPTQSLRNKVSKSVSDVSELTSTATSLMSRKFDRFEEKRRQQLDKRTKVVKSIFRKSQSRDSGRGGSGGGDQHPKAVRQLSAESQSVGQEFNAYLQDLHKDVKISVSKQINLFVEKSLKNVEYQTVEESGELIHQFYNTMEDLLNTYCNTHGLTEDEAHRLMTLTERYITTRLYKSLIAAVNAATEEKDLAIQNRIRSLAWVSSEHLDCGLKETNEGVKEQLDQVITGLIEMNGQRAPSDKLECLVTASLELLRALGESSGPASADDFLPALIFSVLRANPPLLHSNIAFITNFAQQPSLQSGQAGYFFTNLCCAVAYIEKVSGESLGLTEDQFDRYMTGRSLPPGSLHNEDSVWLSQGLRVMQENLNVLDQLVLGRRGGRGGRRLDTLASDADALSDKMDALQLRIETEVDTVLSQTPLVILPPRSAHLDDDLPSSAKLPPPLTPQAAVESSTASDRSFFDMPQFTQSIGIESQSDGVTGQEGSRTTAVLGPLSPDILAAQESLSFLQHLSDIQPELSLLPDTTTNDMPTSTAGGQVDNRLFQESQKEFAAPSAVNSTFSGVLDPFGPLEDDDLSEPSLPSSAKASPRPNSTTLSGSSSSGFTIQGGQIPSIPCDAGQVPTLTSPLDPTPPLLPTPSGTRAEQGGASGEPDTIDKVYNVLGDIVQTFDNLL